MSVSDCATHAELPEPDFDGTAGPANRRSQPLKNVLFWFAATVILGLALASWYVGLRIVAADESAPPALSVSPAVHARPMAATSKVPVTNAFRYTVPPPTFKPPTFNLYLQVAGLSPRQDATFVKWLHRQGFQALVQSSDEENPGLQNNPQILIGPFPDGARMGKARRKLQFAGVLALEVTH